MAKRSLLLDTSGSTYVFDGCEQSADRRTGEVKMTDDGLYKWIVNLLEKKQGIAGSTPIKLHVAAKSNPCNGFSDYQPLAIKGMVYHQSTDSEGRLIEWFTADAVAKA